VVFGEDCGIEIAVIVQAGPVSFHMCTVYTGIKKMGSPKEFTDPVVNDILTPCLNRMM
jgi:hypothetical protein